METNIPWLSSFTNKKLDLILLVTEQCNFRCVYCYEDFKLGKMAPEIIEGVKNLILKRADEIDQLSLSFFGGEPLLNKSSILELSKWAAHFCTEHDISYLGGVTTNGYSLDRETFSNMIQSGVSSYQITLDGEKGIHDLLRPTINGKSTFDKIYGNITMIANTSHRFQCAIRFNIADANFESVKSFMLNYTKPFKNDDRFTFHFHPIFGMTDLKLTKDDQLHQLKEIAASNNFKYSVPLDDVEYACYASRANSFVIRADGRVQKCTVALESDINTIGKIDKEGVLELDQSKLKKWLFAENKSCPVQSLTLEKLVVPYENSGKYTQRFVS